jgi:protein-S-isoprenylcysteine O-methyltransferase Ste14
VDTARYVFGLLTVIAAIPALGFWLAAHGFIRRWRRLGPVFSYTVLVALMVVLGLAAYAMRKQLLGRDLGTNPWLIGLAVLTCAAGLAIELQVRKHLSLRILVGLPELSPDRTSQRLLQQGIYARVRHPRYLGSILGLLALTFFSNHLGLYLLCPAFVLGIYGVTALEERELVQRFGDEYEAYRSRVPRLLPRLRPGRRSTV